MDALTRSIQEFGVVDPVIVRRADRTVVGGHQRLRAARRLGLDRVPVVFVDLSVERARLLNLALNRISGEWDEELLARLLADLEEAPAVDLSLSGFGEDEIDGLLRTLERREKRTRYEAFDLEAAWQAAQGESGISPGDVFALGDHRLACGDAARAADVAALMGGKRAAMAFTDPPYNVSYGDHGGQQKGGRRRRIENDAMTAEQWEVFVRGWGTNVLRHVDGALYVCMSCKEWPTVSRILDELGGHWSTTIIWAKDRFVLGRADYQRQYEPIWYGWRQGSGRQWCGDRDQGDVWSLPRPVAKRRGLPRRRSPDSCSKRRIALV
jgi:ParB-like chromosome segregation protein Spo0J